VIVPTSSRCVAIAREAAASLRFDSEDGGVVAFEHTEAGGLAAHDSPPTNLLFVQRILAGLAVHCNVAGAVIVSRGDEVLTSEGLVAFMRDNGYPLEHVPHTVLTLGSVSFEECVAEVSSAAEKLFLATRGVERVERPASELVVALQCGGSDAFSGISANPLAGSVAKEIIRRGGSAVLAETDELIGAESWILRSVRDATVAARFVELIRVFRERLAWHGQTAEANPSVGNNFRGLYNIALKSLGAATKKPFDVRLDDVLDYGQPLGHRGYVFMNSPGNDIESIAGQVATGCNVIFFTTGNGSITNFPIVPTLKIVTNTGRFSKLARDMDVNAGAYLDGTSMEALTAAVLSQALSAASGNPTAGERSGHSQVQIWRAWPRTSTDGLTEALGAATPDSASLSLVEREDEIESPPIPPIECFPTKVSRSPTRIGLILPTSLCSAQIARLVADKLNDDLLSEDAQVDRFVALPHTEGCGSSGPMNEYFASMTGHLLHPAVWRGVLLEHGCEKLHNDEMRSSIEASGLAVDDYGWVSIQLDGGIEAVMAKIRRYFAEQAKASPPPVSCPEPISGFTVAITADGSLPHLAAEAFAKLARRLVRMGANVVVPSTCQLLDTEAFERFVLATGKDTPPSIAFGQRIASHGISRVASPLPKTQAGVYPLAEHGLHVMQCPTRDWIESLTGLAATGADIVVAFARGPIVGHPMVPVLCVAMSEEETPDADYCLSSPGHSSLLETVAKVLAKERVTQVDRVRNTGWQITRGRLCVSV
jgi:altronate dehydratase